MGCETTNATVDARCEVSVEEPSDSWLLGSEVDIQAHPLTEIFDTTVLLNDIELLPIAINKSECSSCDECRLSVGCTDCAFCPSCETTCEECFHTVSVLIPETLESRTEYWLTIFNSLGSSDPILVNIVDSDSE
jgi:hypothetical protein